MALFKGKKEKTKKKNNVNIVRTLVIIATVLALMVGTYAIARPKIVYTIANSMEQKGNMEGAYDLYIGLNDYKDSTQRAWNIKYNGEVEAITKAEIGEVVTFGAYEQDNDEENGKEDIEWIVLDKTEDKALLFAKKILDAQPYNTEKVAITWENSSLRAWLNETFFGTAFHADEKAHISDSKVMAERNPDYYTKPGRSTTDKLFLLCNSESLEYITSRAIRSAAVTDYAVANGVYKNGSTGTGFWWLRMPGDKQDKAGYVYYHGYNDSIGDDVDKTFYGVRPAMWVTFEAADEAAE